MRTLIEKTLNKVLKSGGYENYFIISIDEDYYLQGACANGDNFIDLELTGEKYLPESKKYRSETKAIIRELAWEYPNSENDNYFQILASVSNDEISHVATTIVETIKSVFKIEDLDSNQIEINLLDD